MRNIKDLKFQEKDKSIYILANGPSVLMEDLSLLKDKVVIGMNASTLLDEKFNFNSKYYVCSDSRFLRHPEKGLLATDKVNSSTFRVFRKELDQYDTYANKNNTYYIKALQRDGFSTDLRVGYYYGCTTTMLAIQLAYYLGAKKIVLLGVDLRYSKSQPRFYDETSFQIDDSFTSIQISNILNAFKFLSKKDVEVINCSENSYLRPYIGFKKFIDTVVDF